ncbi:MAG: mannose-1-phosphate guanyltransferase, partial [Sphingomonadaceae bacterium]|nr:mannose-1-phosphate guanyltransferase [Sphingomonadaceae bacterium]
GVIEAELAAAGIADARVILEPSARNTAAAIALAAHATDPDACLLVMPSDHIIADASAFDAGVDRAAGLAGEGWLVTFGIEPTGPETGYGYIRRGDPLGEQGFAVDRFVEKPDRATAEGFLAQGGHYWNGGIFLFRAGSFLGALAVHAPEIFRAARAAFDMASREGATIRPDAEAFAISPSISVDYAVMERAPHVAVVPVSMGWSDLGSWDALHDLADKDEAGNCLSGTAVAIDSSGCLIRGEGPLVAAIGVSDLVIVATADAVLIMPRGESQRVKEIVERLKADPQGKEFL